MSLTGIVQSLNGTVSFEPDDTETQQSVFHEVKVFNITLSAIALLILTVAGIITGVSYQRYRRKCKQACILENAVVCEDPEEPVGVTGVRQTHRFRNPFAPSRGAERLEDDSQIHYIYNNPLPMEEDGVSPHTVSTPTSLNLQDYTSDTNSDIILVPPIILHATADSAH